jgi:hypothetical protein
MEFLKRHYEKIVLCLVLLGLAGAAIWMKTKMDNVSTSAPPPPRPPGRITPPAPINLVTDELALAQITNPPPVVLNGDHNLFNPVTWKRLPNGEIKKFIKTGADALSVTGITPLYTIISYDHPSGNGPIYIMTTAQHVDLRHPGRKASEFAKKDEKPKSGLYTIRGIKGAPEDPTELELEIPETGETVTVSTNKPYQRVDSCIADLKYDPDPGLPLRKQSVNDTIKLDADIYKIVEITNNAVRVQSARTTKVTEVKLMETNESR